MNSAVSVSSFQLRRGPTTLTQAEVLQIQRARMLAAALDTIEHVGFQRMTIARVILGARVSRKTFYDVFSDREDCFLAVFEQAFTRARALAGQAYAGGTCWREGIRLALRQLLVLVEDEPARAKVCVIESCCSGHRVAALRARMLGDFARTIDLGRMERGQALDPPRVTADVIVGGIFAVLHSHLRRDGGRRVTGLSSELMSMVVLPYLGEAAAREELATPALERPRGARRPSPATAVDKLEGLRLRLTYRTVRVLSTIEEHPGASNRDVAAMAGIIDQGQVSKLLSRLSRLGLIENRAHGQSRGGANAWWLTARGAEVASTGRSG
jgi:AcrR family transcriptional regulator